VTYRCGIGIKRAGRTIAVRSVRLIDNGNRHDVDPAVAPAVDSGCVARHLRFRRSMRCIQIRQLYTKCLENDHAHAAINCAMSATGMETSGNGEQSVRSTASQRSVASRLGAVPAHRGIWAGLSSDPLADAVQEAICEGRLPAGTRLGEEELCRIFGVSRTLVRQALQRLSFAGLVTLRPNRGAFVAAPTLDETAEAYAARRLVEADIIAEATRHCTANDIRGLRNHLKLQAEASSGGHRSALLRLLGEFHLVIATIGGNQILADFVAQLVPRTTLSLALFERRDLPSCALDEHRLLIDLMAKGDAKAAAQAMRRHLSSDFSRLAMKDTAEPMVNLAAALKIAGAAKP
jgi:DNA-binding GntR family transcriptional regulator